MATSFVLKQKKQKFKTAEKASFRSWPALQIRENRGWKVCAFARCASALAKIPMPCRRAGPALFSLISAEAFLLSGLGVHN
jgi:hypothetical protein